MSAERTRVIISLGGQRLNFKPLDGLPQYLQWEAAATAYEVAVKRFNGANTWADRAQAATDAQAAAFSAFQTFDREAADLQRIESAKIEEIRIALDELRIGALGPWA